MNTFRLAGLNSDHDQNLDADFASFHVFNYAMTLSDAKDWADYVDRRYANHGSPANLGYLANVSEATPSDGQALVYDTSTSQWQPGTVATSGGTSVTANPDLSGNEANLTSLTVGSTKYKIGTSINALSYSDTSKLLLSYPFSLASDQAGTSTNYGSLTPSSTNNTAVYESNVGLRFTSDANANEDIFNVTIPTGLTSSFTAYVKYKQASGGDEPYPAVLYLSSPVSNNERFPSILASYSTSAQGGNSNFLTQIKYGTTIVNNSDIFNGSYDRWYHLFIVVDKNAGKVKTYVDSTTSGVLTNYPKDVSDNLNGIDNFLLAGRFDGNGPTNRNLDGDFAAFHVFNYAMSLSDAQDWADYVDRGYVNQGSPANLGYLANVSEATPSDGQALVYDTSTSQWQPGTVATASALDGLTDVSAASASDGQALVYDTSTSQWQPGTAGTSVTANPGGTPLTTLSTVTIADTDYNVGTGVRQLSYSDSSKLLLSYPFSAAANATDAQTNYGSETPNNTVFDYDGFVSGTGFQLRSSANNANNNDDNINITKTSGSFVGNEFTIYIRFKVRDDLVGDSRARIFESRNANGDDTSRIVINFESDANGNGTPNASFSIWGSYFSGTLKPFGTGSIPVGVWYNVFVSLNFNTQTGHVFMNPNGGSNLNSYQLSNVTGTPQMGNIQLNTYHGDNDYHHNTDFFGLFVVQFEIVDFRGAGMDGFRRGRLRQPGSRVAFLLVQRQRNTPLGRPGACLQFICVAVATSFRLEFHFHSWAEFVRPGKLLGGRRGFEQAESQLHAPTIRHDNSKPGFRQLQVLCDGFIHEILFHRCLF